jgi:uncharacterized protein
MEESLRDVLVMAKPAGARCNLRCSYCYYLSKTRLFPDSPAPRMPEDLLERYIQQRLQASPGPVTHFEWHGGEPTLLGLDYFRRIVEIQRLHAPADRQITNGIQTNGTLLDDDWGRFLREARFSVGLSLDGPAECHDPFRSTIEGRGTHEDVVHAFHLLRRHKVHCDILCVLHQGNVDKPVDVYGYFKQLGVTHLQFLPLAGPGAADPKLLGEFLCRVFDEWIRHDLGRIVIQLFDEALRPALGLPHALCHFRETCGDVLVLEHEGGLYACDHFVNPEHRIGSLREQPLAKLLHSPALTAFGMAKRDRLPKVCRACDVLAWCNGGCPKDRDPETNLNVMCPAYQRFFRHCKPIMARLAAHWKSGRPLSEFGKRRPRA